MGVYRTRQPVSFLHEGGVRRIPKAGVVTEIDDAIAASLGDAVVPHDNAAPEPEATPEPTPEPTPETALDPPADSTETVEPQSELDLSDPGATPRPRRPRNTEGGDGG